MCASCGCHKPDMDRGDSRHITMRDREEAAKAARISITDVIENLRLAAQGYPNDDRDHERPKHTAHP